MKKLLNLIIRQIFPSFSCKKINKGLKQKVESNDSQSNIPFMNSVDQITIDSFREKYFDTFETKNKFEDKAKTNVIGITIAITLIMGASSIITSIVNKYTFVFMHWVEAYP